MGYRTQFWEYEQTGDDKLIERLENENAQLKSDYLALTEKHQREINGWAESLQQREQVVETVKAELAQAQQREARLREALKSVLDCITSVEPEDQQHRGWHSFGVWMYAGDAIAEIDADTLKQAKCTLEEHL